MTIKSMSTKNQEKYDDSNKKSNLIVNSNGRLLEG